MSETGGGVGCEGVGGLCGTGGGADAFHFTGSLGSLDTLKDLGVFEHLAGSGTSDVFGLKLPGDIGKGAPESSFSKAGEIPPSVVGGSVRVSSGDQLEGIADVGGDGEEMCDDNYNAHPKGNPAPSRYAGDRPHDTSAVGGGDVASAQTSPAFETEVVAAGHRENAIGCGKSVCGGGSGSARDHPSVDVTPSISNVPQVLHAPPFVKPDPASLYAAGTAPAVLDMSQVSRPSPFADVANNEKAVCSGTAAHGRRPSLLPPSRDASSGVGFDMAGFGVDEGVHQRVGEQPSDASGRFFPQGSSLINKPPQSTASFGPLHGAPSRASVGHPPWHVATTPQPEWTTFNRCGNPSLAAACGVERVRSITPEAQTHGGGAAAFAGAAMSNRGRGVSQETMLLLESLRETRETLWSVANPPVQPAPCWHQAGSFPGGRPPPEWSPAPSCPPPAPQSATSALGSTTAAPARNGGSGENTTPPSQTRSISVQAEAPPTPLPPPGGDRVAGLSDLAGVRRGFQVSLQAMREQFLPELRAQREVLLRDVQGIDSRLKELKRRVLEAEREGREEFEALRAHLKSVENMKMAVLCRERDVRAELVDGIDSIVQRVQQTEAGGRSLEEMAAFLRADPEIRELAETLWSRSTSLANVVVPIDDVPFEARERREMLRKLTVMNQLNQLKDLAIWRIEAQRQQFIAQASKTSAWVRQLEALLERYSEELAFACYFCAESFSSCAANSNCPRNTGCSPRSGRSLPPEPRVPAHLWGMGCHFWVHQPQHAAPPSGARAPIQPAWQRDRPSASPVSIANARSQLQDADGERLGSFMSQVPSRTPKGERPSRPSTPPRQVVVTAPGHVADPRGLTTSPRGAPLRGAAARQVQSHVVADTRDPSSADAVAAQASAAACAAATTQVDLNLRRIALACETRCLDIRTAFKTFDTDGNGFISKHEIRQAIVQLRLGLSDVDIADLSERLDTNSDGLVSYEEFLTQMFKAARDPLVAGVGPAMIEHLAAKDDVAQALWMRVSKSFRDRGVPLAQAFNLFDVDGNGVISRAELADAFRLMRLGLNDEDVDRLLRNVDANQDGCVSVQELVSRLQQ